MQYWLVERQDERTDIRYMYFCTAAGRETAKRMANNFLLGNSDDYIVTPLTNPGDTVQMRINIQAS